MAYLIAWRSPETGHHYLPTSVMRRYANHADIVVVVAVVKAGAYGSRWS